MKCFEVFVVCVAYFLGLNISDLYDRLSHTCRYIYDNDTKKTSSDISLEKWISMYFLPKMNFCQLSLAQSTSDLWCQTSLNLI